MTSPVTASPLDALHCPPFGMGFERSITELTTGVTSSGLAYQGFEYAWSEHESFLSVATPGLSSCLPSFFASLPQNPRPGIHGVQVPNQAGLGGGASATEASRWSPTCADYSSG